MNNSRGTGVDGPAQTPETRRPRYGKARQKVYLGALFFVVFVGLPIVGLPSLRYRLRSRVETLRAALRGIPAPPAPAVAEVGQNSEPFPAEYQHPEVKLPGFNIAAEAPAARPTFRPSMGSRSAGAAVAPKAEVQELPVPAISGTVASQAPAAAEAGTDPQYKKGKSEQEAYDLLLNSNQILSGMVRGADAALQFQDWSAASMGNESYYVMVTFVQTSDGVVRRYIWNVKLMSKEILPLSSYARSISK